MTDTELLIKIKTALESGGLDAAKKALKEVTDQTKESTAENAKATIESARVDKISAQLAATLQKIPAALRGSPEAIRSLIGDIGKLSASLAPLAAAGAAALGGWKVGTLIDEMTGLSDKISRMLVPAVENIEGPARRAREQLAKLDEIKFTSLEKQLADVQQKFDSLTKDIDDFARRQGAEASSRSRLTAAGVAGQPDGIPRDRAAAEATFAAAEEDAYLKRRRIDDRRQVLTTEASGTRAALGKYEGGLQEARRQEEAAAVTSIRSKGGTGEELARAAQEVKAARENLVREQAAYNDKVPEIRARLAAIESEFAELDSNVNVVNTDLQTAATIRDNALSKLAETFARETEAANKTAAAEQAKADKARLAEAAQAAQEQSTASAKALQDQLPVLQSNLSKEQGEAARAQAAVEEFNRTGKINGRRQPGGRTNSIERRKLEQAAANEADDVSSAENALTGAESIIAQNMDRQKALAESIRSLGDAETSAIETMIAVVEENARKMSELEARLRNQP